MLNEYNHHENPFLIIEISLSANCTVIFFTNVLLLGKHSFYLFLALEFFVLFLDAAKSFLQ